ncbi:MAG: SdiA-regulated domain-containing protein [Myxococcales bacterium]|nr:SdiA-regulated domain-containing protein [Myxococcales bacterium]
MRVTPPRRFWALAAVLAAGCARGVPGEVEASYVSGKADGLPDRLRKVDDHRLHVDEPSDLAFADGRLFTVSDAHSRIYEIDDDGDVRSELDVEGRDLEALAIDRDGDFVIADESRATIWHIAADGERHDPIEVPDADDGNSGIEGLAFDRAGHLLVAKEKDPARIIEIDERGDERRNEKIDFAEDLSALAWNPEDRHLYALSDEDHTLFRLDADWEVITAWKLPVKHPEGLAFDGNLVYVASDSEERLYLYELAD